MNRRVSVQQRSTTLDTFGGQPETWTEIKVIFACISALSGSERLAAQSTMSEVTHRFTVRYDPMFVDPKVVAAYRLVYNNRIFDVQNSENIDEANHVIELLAAEGMTLG